ncbi:hypothetical protein sphantq_03139 [Sphingobium sp. AntQ-1]|uniref:hypothetical protein n=1 Tax=Sphingobium sp. AntQ-1 TaxID=2930091 RepID=UPI00234F91DA|nr:hypothetical protein [Sphingobium sp. AntQ-1]WCP14690.1 hypothetical protein sphantq_03139 [Sphingobium sp. AntQ-1]
MKGLVRKDRPLLLGGHGDGGTGMGAETGARGGLVARRQRVGGTARAQKGKARKDGWTKVKERRFLETLAETCNASEAAREAGMCRASAYRRRQSDAGFARAWEEALDVGYAEIEALLMREVLFGSEVEELTLDGEGVVKGRKVKRTRNLTVALRLLTLHRDRVDRRRAEAGQGAAGRPDSPDAIARVEDVLGAIGRRRVAVEM